MANQHHLDLLQQGPEVWNEWKRIHPYEAGDFSAADLHGMNLTGAHLNGANFAGVDLAHAPF